MNHRTNTTRLLAGLLAVYAAAQMCRTAAALTEETRRNQVLRQSCQTLTAEIAAQKDGSELLPLYVRAWRQLGMVSPEDVVFFDAG